MSDLCDLMVIAPHPDDSEFGIGGTVARLTKEGKKVVYDIVREEGKSRLVVIASNEVKDLELCSEVLLLEKFK